MDVLERFNEKIQLDIESGCHVWTAAKQESGYGKFADHGSHRAHRWIYRELVGEIPEGMHVDHLCNNRACVNVEHLRLATPKENSLAAHSKATARINTDKTNCPRGHLLADWNVYPAFLKKGERSCKACLLAQSRNRYRNRPEGWWREEADRLYAEYKAAA